MIYSDDYFMNEALKQAKIAFEQDEIPVGAIITYKNSIITRAYNQSVQLNDSTAHAEILAISAAGTNSGIKYLNEATLYVTLEPCIMCIGAIYWAKIGKIVFGAYDTKQGYSKYNSILQKENLNLIHPKTQIIGGVKEQESAALLQDFFKSKR